MSQLPNVPTMCGCASVTQKYAASDESASMTRLTYVALRLKEGGVQVCQSQSGAHCQQGQQGTLGQVSLLFPKTELRRSKSAMQRICQTRELW